jgi:hypothetical protein
MSRARNETNIPMSLPIELQIGLDTFQASILPSRPRVRLETNIIKRGDLFQPVSQTFNHLGVAFGLVFWDEGVDVELGPGHGKHLGGGV